MDQYHKTWWLSLIIIVYHCNCHVSLLFIIDHSCHHHRHSYHCDYAKCYWFCYRDHNHYHYPYELLSLSLLILHDG